MNNFEHTYNSIHANCAISLAVRDGELTLASCWKYGDGCHNLPDSPYWSRAQECLECLYHDDLVKFRVLVGCLSKESQGYVIVKNIKRNMIYRAKEELKRVTDSFDFI